MSTLCVGGILLSALRRRLALHCSILESPSWSDMSGESGSRNWRRKSLRAAEERSLWCGGRMIGLRPWPPISQPCTLHTSDSPRNVLEIQSRYSTGVQVRFALTVSREEPGPNLTSNWLWFFGTQAHRCEAKAFDLTVSVGLVQQKPLDCLFPGILLHVYTLIPGKWAQKESTEGVVSAYVHATICAEQTTCILDRRKTRFAFVSECWTLAQHWNLSTWRCGHSIFHCAWDDGWPMHNKVPVVIGACKVEPSPTGPAQFPVFVTQFHGILLTGCNHLSIVTPRLFPRFCKLTNPSKVRTLKCVGYGIQYLCCQPQSVRLYNRHAELRICMV